MKTFFCSVVVCLLVGALGFSPTDKQSPPRVEVYSRAPGYFGRPNTLVCHVSNFHPPEITIDLLSGGNPMNNANQTDLAFTDNWHYHLTKHVTFTPKEGQEFACRVTHMGKTSTFNWESDM